MRKLFILMMIFLFSVQTYALTEEESVLYKKWSIPEPNINDLSMSRDCVGFTSNFSGTGDLISTLIVNSTFRENIKQPQYSTDDMKKLDDIHLLVKYTPEYLKTLDLTISKTLKRNFYTRFACNIGNNVDIVAGSYSSKSSMSDTLLFRNGKKVFILAKNIKIYDNSATGAEISHCGAIPKNNESFLWSCFMGLAKKNGDIIGDSLTEYTISFKTGRVLKVRSYIE